MFCGQTLDVGRIIEVASALYIYVTWVILSDALETAFARVHRMASPTGLSKPAISSPNQNTTIDDRDEVRIGDVVQNVSAPWSVDAAKNEVAVQSFLKTSLLRHSKR
jgi:hypothetical protein